MGGRVMNADSPSPLSLASLFCGSASKSRSCMGDKAEYVADVVMDASKGAYLRHIARRMSWEHIRRRDWARRARISTCFFLMALLRRLGRRD